MSLAPIGDRIVLEVIDNESVTAGGVYLPDAAKDRPDRAKVVAVGEGRYENGALVPLSVLVGDVVYFSKYGGVELSDGGTDYLVVRESDILAREV